MLQHLPDNAEISWGKFIVNDVCTAEHNSLAAKPALVVSYQLRYSVDPDVNDGVLGTYPPPDTKVTTPKIYHSLHPALAHEILYQRWIGDRETVSGALPRNKTLPLLPAPTARSGMSV
jgi:hypothetical protein